VGVEASPEDEEGRGKGMRVVVEREKTKKNGIKCVQDGLNQRQTYDWENLVGPKGNEKKDKMCGYRRVY